MERTELIKIVFDELNWLRVFSAIDVDKLANKLSSKIYAEMIKPSIRSLDWQIAAGISSEEIARLTEQENNVKEKTDEYERAMNYPPLSWGSKDLEPLAKHLAKQTLEDIQRFAEWSKNPYNGLSPAKARQYPKLVIDLWLQANEIRKEPNNKEYDNDAIIKSIMENM